MYTERAQDPTSIVFSLMSGHAVVRSLVVVTELGVADLLKSGAKSASDLAEQCGVDEQSLYRLMRALSALGVFVESGPPYRFELSPVSERLRRDVPNSLRDFVLIRGHRMYWEAWGALEKGVRTGEAAFEHAHGTTHFTYLEDHPEEAHVFHNGMRSLSSQVYAAVIRAYDFSQFRTVIDVGGGQGVLLAEILNAHPSLRGILFDSSSAVEQSVHVLQTAGVTDRCEAVSGDFFANIPAGADAVILSRILHNWDDADALRILKNCRLALPSGGKLIIVEYVITDDAAGLSAKLFDLQMLVYFGRARERSEAEYQSLLQGAGFSLARVVHTSATIAVIEAVAENRPM